jgi:hypothetical protein
MVTLIVQALSTALAANNEGYCATQVGGWEVYAVQLAPNSLQSRRCAAAAAAAAARKQHPTAAHWPVKGMSAYAPHCSS